MATVADKVALHHEFFQRVCGMIGAGNPRLISQPVDGQIGTAEATLEDDVIKFKVNIAEPTERGQSIHAQLYLGSFQAEDVRLSRRGSRYVGQITEFDTTRNYSVGLRLV